MLTVARVVSYRSPPKIPLDSSSPQSVLLVPLFLLLLPVVVDIVGVVATVYSSLHHVLADRKPLVGVATFSLSFYYALIYYMVLYY